MNPALRDKLLATVYSMTQDPISIRRMTIEDLPAVMAIERDSFVTPWKKQHFLYELNDNPRSIFYIAEHRKNILGYAGAWVVHPAIHIINLAVHKHSRCKGIGRQLLSHLFNEGIAHGITQASLEVRISNREAQNFYRKMCFKPVALRRNYYIDNGEDALVMWREI